jgi:antitoxin (DNA-binding transcriptional repressor) of toxin-antitoxin stability system
LIDKTGPGEAIVVTRNGQPVADLIVRKKTFAEAVAGLKRHHKISISGLSIPDLIREGHRT